MKFCSSARFGASIGVDLAMPAKRTPSAKGAKPASGGALLTTTVARLEVDNAQLAAKLAAAELKIAVLERQRDEALNRINWVIDSLNTMVQDTK